MVFENSRIQYLNVWVLWCSFDEQPNASALMPLKRLHRRGDSIFLTRAHALELEPVWVKFQQLIFIVRSLIRLRDLNTLRDIVVERLEHGQPP